MKFMISLVIVVILFSAFQLSHAENLDCIFEDVDHWLTFYTCSVTSFKNENNKVITGYTGTHAENKEKNDVKMIFIKDTEVEYIPEKIGLLFDLTAYVMRNCKLMKIRPKDFVGMENLEYIDLGGNELRVIPSNAFSKLVKLKYIILSYNQIEEVSNGVFNNNPDLMSVLFANNKIKFIGSAVFDETTNLVGVNLGENICLSKDYNQIKEINQLRQDIELKCKSPNDAIDLKMMEIGTKFSSQIDELKKLLSFC